MNENKLNNSTSVLIIDDDVNIMYILSVMLKKYNCDVKTYTEPVSAIEELKSKKYDILILNFLMSPVNGDRIVKLVREFDKEIYIILMSAFVASSIFLDLIILLGEQFLSKSFFKNIILTSF